MKFMLLIYGDEHALTESERESCYLESAQVGQDLHAGGKYLGASPLQLTKTASSVRVREGKSIVTDGPFAETREQLGGFFLVEAENQEEAIAIAAKIPGARWGTVEVRPVLEMDGLPEI
jgi:hypothetical protein